MPSSIVRNRFRPMCSMVRDYIRVGRLLPATWMFVEKAKGDKKRFETIQPKKGIFSLEFPRHVERTLKLVGLSP